MQVYIDTDGSLSCAPFGRKDHFDTVGNAIPFTRATF